MFKEDIRIREELEIRIMDTKTGKITVKKIKQLPENMSWVDKFLHFLRIKDQPGTILDAGKNNMAKLLGSLGGYPINQVQADYAGGSIVKTTTAELQSVGTLIISNSANPFSGGYNYTAVKCRNSSEPTTPYNSISIDFKLGNAPSYVWWVDVKFVFS